MVILGKELHKGKKLSFAIWYIKIDEETATIQMYKAEK